MDMDIELDVQVSKEVIEDTELDEMKKRLKEMEDEAAAAALQELQAKVEKEMSSVHGDNKVIQDPFDAVVTQGNKEEVDARSVFVGNVDYSCTPDEVQQHFEACGTVSRVTIRSDKYGQPKGYAYVEFLEPEAVQEAILMNDTELHGRPLKVTAKRTNVPGLKQLPPRRIDSYAGYPPRAYMLSTYGYHGKASRYRPPMRYSPYY